jgi:hypothetical protein
MNKRLLLAVAAVSLSACPGQKASWTAHDAGPIALEFPCKPETAAAVTKCMRSDGALYAIAVVDKGVSPEQALQDTVEYAKGLQKTTVLAAEAFPVRWREERQFGMVESAVWYLGGKEYTIYVQYSSHKEPAELPEFFSKVKVK